MWEKTSQKDTVIWEYHVLKLWKKQKYTFTYLCFVPTEFKRDWKGEMVWEFVNLLAVYLKWKGVFIIIVDLIIVN